MSNSVLNDLIDSISSHEISQICVGAFDIMVCARQCGLASTMRDCVSRLHPQAVRNLGNLHKMDVKELAKFSRSSHQLEASIGMAAINAGLSINTELLFPLNAKVLFMKKGRGKRGAIIGHFPFLEQIQHEFSNLFIFEKNPLPGDYTEKDMPRILPTVDVLAITSTTLINDSFRSILSMVSPRTYVILLGPTTPLHPLLFDVGVDALCGAIVENEKTVFQYVSQGALFCMIKGVRHVTMTRSRLDKNIFQIT